MSDTPTVTVTPSTDPGPAGRMQRTVGQIAGSAILLELVFAFGWFGSETWTERQVLAVSGTVYFLAAAGHNLVNWWKARNQPTPPPSAVEVAAVNAEPDPIPSRPVRKPRKRVARDDGQVWLYVLVGALAAIVVLALAGRITL